MEISTGEEGGLKGVEVSHDVGGSSLFDVLVVVAGVVVAAVLFPMISDDLLNGDEGPFGRILVLESKDRQPSFFQIIVVVWWWLLSVSRDQKKKNEKKLT